MRLWAAVDAAKHAAPPYCRLDEATSGAIMLDAQGIQGVHKDTRVLFQEHRLLPWKKNIDNVRIGVKSGDKEIAFKALQQVGLEHKRMTGQLCCLEDNDKGWRLLGRLPEIKVAAFG